LSNNNKFFLLCRSRLNYADFDIKNNIGNAVLMLSIMTNDRKAVELLLKAGADVRNNKREQAINLAKMIQDKRLSN